MDVAAIQSAIGSLTMASNLAKKFLKVSSAAETQALVIELQREILGAQHSALAAQSEQLAMAEKVRALKEEIARIKAWEEQKKRYSLVPILSGAVAYALKIECNATEPPHWICAKCYEDGCKSILNPRKNPDKYYSYVCPRCRAEIQSNFTSASSMKYAEPQNAGETTAQKLDHDSSSSIVI